MNVKLIFTIFIMIYFLLFFTNHNVHAENQYEAGQMIVKFQNGIIVVPEGESSVEPDEETVDDEDILTLLENISTSQLDKLFPDAEYGDSTITSLITDEEVTLHDWSQVFIIYFDEEEDVEDAVDDMNELESVIYAEPNGIVTPDSIPDDPLYSDQWYLKNSVNSEFDISAESAWDYSKGNNIIVSIIDEGSDVSHEDLISHVYTGGGTETGLPSGNHGTYVAGIVAATTDNDTGVAGIGWDSKLMPRDCHVWTIDSLVYDIFDASINHGAHVLNCSWHSTNNFSTLSNAIEDVFNNGSNIVASMGNSTGSYTWYPAAYNSWVLAVGALLKVNNGDTLYKRNDMNSGSWIDVTAPGDSLRTTQWRTNDPNNHSRYSWFGMTSAAAPVVSGVVALVRAEFPNKTPTQVMDIIRNSAVLFSGWENDFNHYGHGMVNAKYAVAPPDTPQNLAVNEVSNHPYLTWNDNCEPDLKCYNIYKKVGSGSFDSLTSVTNNYFTDLDELMNGSQQYPYPTIVQYKINAEDLTLLESDFSSAVQCTCKGDPLEKPIVSDPSNPLLEDKVNIPDKYIVSQNFPNPFNPETQIDFGIPEDNFVNLVVYNIQGQKVVTLVNEQLSAGSYTSKFNGSLLPSGVYIYKIQAGSFSQIKRMLLIK